MACFLEAYLIEFNRPYLESHRFICLYQVYTPPRHLTVLVKFSFIQTILLLVVIRVFTSKSPKFISSATQNDAINQTEENRLRTRINLNLNRFDE
jgi:hypothetical protein